MWACTICTKSKCVKWRGTHDVTPYECLWSSGSGSGCCVETVWVSLETWEREQRRREQLSGSHQESVVIMSTMNDVHQFRSKTPSFLISAEPPAQVWSLVKYLWPCMSCRFGLYQFYFKFDNIVYTHIYFASGVAHLSAEQVGSGGGNLLLQEPCRGQKHHNFWSDNIPSSVFRWQCCSRRTSTWTSWGGRQTRRGSMCRRRYRTWW